MPDGKQDTDNRATDEKYATCQQENNQVQHARIERIDCHTSL